MYENQIDVFPWDSCLQVSENPIPNGLGKKEGFTGSDNRKVLGTCDWRPTLLHSLSHSLSPAPCDKPSNLWLRTVPHDSHWYIQVWQEREWVSELPQSTVPSSSLALIGSWAGSWTNHRGPWQGAWLSQKKTRKPKLGWIDVEWPRNKSIDWELWEHRIKVTRAGYMNAWSAIPPFKGPTLKAPLSQFEILNRFLTRRSMLSFKLQIHSSS